MYLPVYMYNHFFVSQLHFISFFILFYFAPFCGVFFYLLLVDGIDRFRRWAVLPETALGLDLSGDRRSSPEAETKF